jgi:hypothetical protein
MFVTFLRLFKWRQSRKFDFKVLAKANALIEG